jgi:hypothetical protein
VKDKLAFVQRRRSDGKLRGKFRSIGAQGGHFNMPANHIAAAGLKQAAEPVPVGFPQALRNDGVGNRFAEDIVAPATEQFFCGRVEIDKSALLVHRHNGVECRVEDGRLARGALAQRPSRLQLDSPRDKMAIAGENGRCRMHGGTSPGAPKGNIETLGSTAAIAPKRSRVDQELSRYARRGNWWTVLLAARFCRELGAPAKLNKRTSAGRESG